MADHTELKCTKCNQVKTLDCFYKYRLYQCIECVRAEKLASYYARRYGDARKRIIRITVEPTKSGFKVSEVPTIYLVGSNRLNLGVVMKGKNAFRHYFYINEGEDSGNLIEATKAVVIGAIQSKINQLNKLLP
jgi:hypothetical protein